MRALGLRRWADCTPTTPHHADSAITFGMLRQVGELPSKFGQEFRARSGNGLASYLPALALGLRGIPRGMSSLPYLNSISTRTSIQKGLSGSGVIVPTGAEILGGSLRGSTSLPDPVSNSTRTCPMRSMSGSWVCTATGAGILRSKDRAGRGQTVGAAMPWS